MKLQSFVLHPVAGALLMLVCATPLFGQEGDANIAEVWRITVKSGHQAEFEAAFKQHAAVRREHEDPRQWDVFTPITGSELNTYSVRTCCYAWADQDAYDKWNFDNAAVMEHWQSSVDAHVESYAHNFYEVDLANSHWPEMGTEILFVGVSEFSVAPAQAAEFSSASAELSQIALNEGWSENHHWAWMTRVGGEPMTLLAVPYANYAAMEPGEETYARFLSEKKGAEEAAALMKRFSSSTSASNYTIWVHRANLTATE